VPSGEQLASELENALTGRVGAVRVLRGTLTETRYELAPNARISDVQCALGTSQLAKLERFVKRRNEIAGQYEELLAGLDVEAR